ncbi:hypothetical protein B0A48_18348 [Cryoendolithus antarcticus]|uniref:NB-ARC domain-containing protein n=1 Tax=Cryoendolithus antarcticus TaxID=1507870 RepID=A0A1V8SAE4_9PEZI|nr:hypothetical protein B0A48_18348 [Cryoendolithus antarcticus]
MNGLPIGSREQSFVNHNSRIANQAGQQTINGGQHIYLAANSPGVHSTTDAEGCFSVPFTIVTTYAERSELSRQLEEKLDKPHLVKKLAHSVAVVGLGGTGKTQLVLRYIEQHEQDYDSILWIDARSEETARSSFERCCRDLRLPVEQASEQGRLCDSPSVQAVHQWLRRRSGKRKWMMIIDNADKLDWGVKTVLPQGQAGSVIVTSQDSHASQMLGRGSQVIRVEEMSADEARTLLLKVVSENSQSASEELLSTTTQIVNTLDRLALAVDLAGARIGSDVDEGAEVHDAMQCYLADFQRHKDRLLRSREYVEATGHDQTIWTVWEASLTSLRDVEKRDTSIHPIDFLALLTCLDRANIQTEMFRLASGGMHEACAATDTELPSWLQDILQRRVNDQDEQWDDYYYRETIKPLVRFGLVRWTQGRWPGLTMHGLVQWRAAKERDEEACWQWYTTFCAAACYHKKHGDSRVEFRRHMLVHLPPIEKMIKEETERRADDQSWIWISIGRVWQDEGRWKQSEELFFAAWQWLGQKLGEEHPSTLTAIANLASTHRDQGRWEEAEELEVKVMEARSRTLGAEHPDTLTAIANLTVTYRNQGRWKEAEELQVNVMEARLRKLGEEHPDRLTAMASLGVTYSKQGNERKAEELKVKVMEAMSRTLGEEHPSTLTAMANLAATYRNQGQWTEGEELEVKVMAAGSRTLGEEHPFTLTAMASLGVTYSMQGKEGKAEELKVKVMEVSSRTLGEEHPDTLTAMANLGVTYSMQGNENKAEELKVKVLEASLRTLGKEHPDTLTRIANLAATYRNQGRWKEADELQVKIMESSSRTLDEEHSSTLTAMANLASTYRSQGPWKEAEELEREHDKAFLAYLSACSTAANSSYELPDEAIYLANAFQIAGSPHIIGTMWEAKDIGATALAGLFYKHFSLSVNDMSSYEDEHDVVAYALHDALQELCKDSKL